MLFMASSFFFAPFAAREATSLRRWAIIPPLCYFSWGIGTKEFIWQAKLLEQYLFTQTNHRLSTFKTFNWQIGPNQARSPRVRSENKSIYNFLIVLGLALQSHSYYVISQLFKMRSRACDSTVGFDLTVVITLTNGSPFLRKQQGNHSFAYWSRTKLLFFFQNCYINIGHMVKSKANNIIQVGGHSGSKIELDSGLMKVPFVLFLKVLEVFRHIEQETSNLSIKALLFLVSFFQIFKTAALEEKFLCDLMGRRTVKALRGRRVEGRLGFFLVWVMFAGMREDKWHVCSLKQNIIYNPRSNEDLKAKSPCFPIFIRFRQAEKQVTSKS